MSECLFCQSLKSFQVYLAITMVYFMFNLSFTLNNKRISRTLQMYTKNWFRNLKDSFALYASHQSFPILTLSHAICEFSRCSLLISMTYLETHCSTAIKVIVMLIIINISRANFGGISSENANKCISDDEDLWDVHAWYFAEAKSITLTILSSVHYNGYLKNYVDRFLKLVHARNKGRTVRIHELNISISRMKRDIKDIQVIDDSWSYKILPESMPNDIRENLNRARMYSGDQEDAHVIIVWNEVSLQAYLKAQPSSIIKNNRATYLIMFIEPYNGTCPIQKNDQFGNILPMIWHDFKVLNVITLAPCSCSPQSIFKYDPFFYDNRTQSWGLVKHRTVSEAKANPFRVINTLRSFKGFTLNITLFERIPSAVRDLPPTMQHYDCMHGDLSHGFSGFDGCIIGNLAYYLNFMVNIVPSNYYGYQLSNGTYTGSLAEVVHKRADISANSRFMTALDINNIEYTTPVSNDVACFIVPHPTSMPQWVMILRCFKIETWLVILLMIAILAIFLNLGRRMDFLTASQRCSYVSDLLKVFGISLSVSINIQTAIHHQRVILASCMIFNVIVAGIFQGSLFTSFSRVSFYPAINTLEQLYDSGLPISTSVDVFQDGQSDILKKLKSRRKYLLENAINRSAYKRDIVAVERQGDARFLIQTKFVSEDGVPLLHIVPECPSSYFLAYAVQKNSPYLPRFNDLLTRFLESGLINKWYRDILNGFIMQKKIHTRVKAHIMKAFTLEDVQTAFYLLILGIIFASITFFCEVLYYKKGGLKKLLRRLLETDN